MIAGIFAGYLGIGGGIILNPILFLYFEGKTGEVDSVHVALGTSLAVAVVTTISSSIGHAVRGRWRPSAIFYLALGVVVSSYFGSWIATNLPGTILKRLFAMLLLLGAYQLFRGSPANRNNEPSTSKILLLATGVVAGIVGSLLGVAGGIVMVPIMIGLLNFPTRVVAGTSSAVAISVALLGALGYIYHGSGNPGLPDGYWGFIDPKSALWLAIGSIPGAQVGAYLNRKWGGEAFRILFAIILLLVAFKLVVFG